MHLYIVVALKKNLCLPFDDMKEIECFSKFNCFQLYVLYFLLLCFPERGLNLNALNLFCSIFVSIYDMMIFGLFLRILVHFFSVLNFFFLTFIVLRTKHFVFRFIFKFLYRRASILFFFLLFIFFHSSLFVIWMEIKKEDKNNKNQRYKEILYIKNKLVVFT